MNRLNKLAVAYTEKFTRMSYIMSPEMDDLDIIYCLPETIKTSNDFMEILGFKQDLNKKTFLTPENEHLFDDDEAYSILFRFLPREGKPLSLRHMNIQSVLFKDVFYLIPHLDRKYPASGQLLYHYFVACCD